MSTTSPTDPQDQQDTTTPDATTLLRRIDLRGNHLSTAQLRRIVPRGGTDIDAVLPAVTPVVDAVRNEGAPAALRYGQQFDGVTPSSVRVPASVIAEALDSLDPTVRDALDRAIARVTAFHTAQLPSDHELELAPGARVAERWVPLDRVGLYVPGGKAVYPSSVVMNVVPATAAGVGSVVVASPPQSTGWPDATVLATCALLGVDEVWAVGGAQAVALMAYGSEPTDSDDALDPVDMITGPGNIFVTAAKRLCRSVVGIDAEAGPTEIAIIADATADPVDVAYDMISQAEHDPMAASVLITDDAGLASAVDAEIRDRYTATLNAERAREALVGEQSAIILVDSIDEAIRVANAYAAEHLEIHTADARAVASRITNAGAIFIGPYSPVPLGDYAAGSNHVLPTSGSARYSSGLSTHTFLKSVHVVDYTQEALAEIGPAVIALAEAEKLPAHGEAIRVRLDRTAAASESTRTANATPQSTAEPQSYEDLPVRDELRGAQPYGAPQLRVSTQLNTNENPYPPSEAIIEGLVERVRASELNRYPERDAVELREALADYMVRQTGAQVTAANLWAANGSNEVLQQLLQAFGGPGRTALGFAPSYSMHPILCAGTHTEYIAIDRDERFDIPLDAALDAIAKHQPDIVFVTSPNNPTGGVTSPEDLRRILDAAPGIVIVDEAYAEFSDQPSAALLLPEYPRSLVVSRTMSKAFDFAGTRLGYFVAHPAFVEAVLLVRLPYHLSSLTQAAAIEALHHSEDTLATVDILRRERDRVVATLTELGFEVIPSHANFIFFGHFDSSADAWQAFLDRDVLIRDVGIPGWLRVTVGTPEENDAFLSAARELTPASASAASPQTDPR